MKVVTVGTSEITKTNIEQMRLAGIEIFACVSRDSERAKNFAKENKVLRFSNDYNNVLLSDEFDFVYLGIPNSLHYEYSKKALLAGKNVILEKPFCINQKQAIELVSIALNKKLYIFENMKTYHQLAFKELVNDIESIKPLKVINLNFTKYSSKYDKFKMNLPQTVFSLDTGSGALMDLNCYNIAFATALFGLPVSSTYICNKTNNIDTSGTAILKYNDFMVNCIAGKDTDAFNFIDICGENGHIYSSCHTSVLDKYEVKYKSGKSKIVEKEEPYPFVPVLKCFKEVYENKDSLKYDQLIKYTFMEMKVLDELRKSANIVYKSEE